jgi:hypothetical protein
MKLSKRCKNIDFDSMVSCRRELLRGLICLMAPGSALTFGACSDGDAIDANNVIEDQTNSLRVFPLENADLWHFMVSGQSLSRAGSDAPIVDSSDLMLSGGLHSPRVDDSRLVPLSNTGTDGVLLAAVGQLKWLIQGGAAANAQASSTQPYRIVLSGHGVNGAGIASLSPGGASRAYEHGLWQVEEVQRLASAQGWKVAVPAISWLQGESNGYSDANWYCEQLIALKNHYNTDVLLRTGQTLRFPLICYQNCSEQHDKPAGVEYESRAAAGTWFATELDPEILVAAPTYWLPHRDGVHLDPVQYRRLGQVWGKVLYQRIFRGEDWRPLRPIAMEWARPDELIVRFHVPAPPLVLDDRSVSDPGSHGFDLRDASGRVTIRQVELVSGTQVRLRLLRPVSGRSWLSYAWYSVGGQPGGPLTGPRGCLRDSDKFLGAFDGSELSNWCLRFKQELPPAL